MRVNINCNDIKKLEVKIPKYNKDVIDRVGNSVRESTFNIEKGAKSNLSNNGSVKTGHLRRSIAAKVRGSVNVEGEVSTNVKYAKGVEEGTRPHIIRAKNAKALYWKGANHPVKQVNHPGSKAKPFLKPSFESELPNFIRNLEKAVEWK